MKAFYNNSDPKFIADNSINTKTSLTVQSRSEENDEEINKKKQEQKMDVMEDSDFILVILQFNLIIKRILLCGPSILL